MFSGTPFALYLPRRTRFTVEATSDSLDIAYGWCAVDADYPPRLVTPDQVPVEIRGDENASRQINGIIPPGFNCQLHPLAPNVQVKLTVTSQVA